MPKQKENESQDDFDKRTLQYYHEYWEQLNQ